MNVRSFIAVVIGGVVDIIVTNILLVPVLIYAMIAGDLTNLPSAELSAALASALVDSPGIQVAGWALGLTATVLGGYTAAWFARRDEVRNGALSAWLCMTLGLLAIAAGDESAPLWQHAVAFILSPLGGAFGGMLRLRAVSAHASSVSAA